MTKYVSIVFILLAMLIGCYSLHPVSKKATKECSALRKVMDENVAVGMPRNDLLKFFHDRGWDASYGKLDDAYYLRFSYPSDRWDHFVTIIVYLEDSKSVKSYSVSDNYVAP